MIFLIIYAFKGLLEDRIDFVNDGSLRISVYLFKQVPRSVFCFFSICSLKSGSTLGSCIYFGKNVYSLLSSAISSLPPSQLSSSVVSSLSFLLIMALPEDQVRILDSDDIEQFPVRLAPKLCDECHNYLKPSVKHQLDTVWSIPSVGFKLSKPSVSQNVFTYNEMNFSLEFLANSETGMENLMIPANEDCFYKDEFLLEPIPLSPLPPEPMITSEEFDNEVNLMMIDTEDFMDAEAPSAPKLVSFQYFLCFY